MRKAAPMKSSDNRLTDYLTAKLSSGWLVMAQNRMEALHYNASIQNQI